MENDNLELLKSIKKVAISDTVFEKLSSRIQMRKNQTIPLYKVAVAASLLIGFMLFEVFMANQQFKEKSLKSMALITINNNQLYHE